MGGGGGLLPTDGGAPLITPAGIPCMYESESKVVSKECPIGHIPTPLYISFMLCNIKPLTVNNIYLSESVLFIKRELRALFSVTGVNPHILK